MDALEKLLSFAHDTRFGDLPVSTVERAKRAVLDTLAVGIAGANAASLPALTALVSHWGGRAEATLLTNGERLPAPLAALVNATAARAWDLDDLHEQNTCHIHASLIPALLALSEARGPVSGRDFIAAVAVGAEIICRLSAAPRVGFTETGSIMSYQCAFYGVAAAAARLLQLPRQKMQHALGLAHARVAGNQQAFLSGAMAVRVMQGVAAEGGLVCALMAEQGITGADDVFEGRYGYFRLHHRGQYDPGELTTDLGRRYLLDGVSIKPLYPCCRFAHGPIDATVLAVSEAQIGVDTIEQIRVAVTNNEVLHLICEPVERKMDPRSPADAQFSLPYLVAWAAIHRRVDFEALRPESLRDSAVRALIAKVKIEVDTAHQDVARGTFPMPGDVSIVERNGRETRRQVSFVKGHPRNPMSYDDVAGKFLACSRFARPEWTGAPAVIERVSRLEALPDVAELVPLCAPARPLSCERPRSVRSTAQS